MSFEIRIPFGLNQFGSVTSITSPDEQAMQHVKSIVATNPGERVMLPEYGIPLRTYVFEPDPVAVTQQIHTDVVTQMAEWEPSIQVLSIEPVIDPFEMGVVDLQVNFATNPVDDSKLSTATVSVGGTVTIGSASDQ